jgi:hypothetical protein
MATKKGKSFRFIGIVSNGVTIQRYEDSMKNEQLTMNKAAVITRTKFGSEAVMKSEAAPRISETPLLRPETPLLSIGISPPPEM